MYKQFIILVLFGCTNSNNTENQYLNKTIPLPKTINQINLPTGYQTVSFKKNSFSDWIQYLPLKKDNTVYLYNKQPKADQSLHEFVLDIDLNNKDLQQCADAIMKLRAFYFFAEKQYEKITFKGTEKEYKFLDYLKQNSCVDTAMVLNKFLDLVFANCGSFNLDSWLKKTSINTIKPGDVFIQPGSPGHAMIVVNVAYNKQTKDTIFMLAQSYMPAQSIHIVKNLSSNILSPWYSTKNNTLITPSWEFKVDEHFKTW